MGQDFVAYMASLWIINKSELFYYPIIKRWFIEPAVVPAYVGLRDALFNR